jgi:hypothetical protein
LLVPIASALLLPIQLDVLERSLSKKLLRPAFAWHHGLPALHQRPRAVISAINSLTLSLTLAAKLLKSHAEPKDRLSASSMVALDALQSVNTPNITTSYVILKPFDERTRTASEINAELNTKFAGIKDGFSYTLLPPPIQGLGNGSGYSLYLKDSGGLGYGALQNAMTAFQAEIAKTPGMTYPVSSCQANTRSSKSRSTALKRRRRALR